jgi:hypothetical protein
VLSRLYRTINDDLYIVTGVNNGYRFDLRRILGHSGLSRERPGEEVMIAYGNFLAVLWLGECGRNNTGKAPPPTRVRYH